MILEITLGDGWTLVLVAEEDNDDAVVGGTGINGDVGKFGDMGVVGRVGVTAMELELAEERRDSMKELRKLVGVPFRGSTTKCRPLMLTNEAASRTAMGEVGMRGAF